MKINLQNRPRDRLLRLLLRPLPENRQTNHTQRQPLPIRIRRPQFPQKSPQMMRRITQGLRQHPPPTNHNRFNKRTTKNLRRPQILAQPLALPPRLPKIPPRMLLKRVIATKLRKCCTLSSILQTQHRRLRAIRLERVSFLSKENSFWNFLCALAKRALSKCRCSRTTT